MSLTYDFDMFSIIPDDVRKEFQGMINDAGASAQMTQQIALFRDPQVPATLKEADEEVRQLFLDAGFGLNTYSSGAPADRFPAMDEQARNACMSRFAENLGTFDKSTPCNWGGFDLQAFIRHFEHAQGMDEVELNAYRAAQDQAARRQAARGKLVRGGLAAGGVLLVAVAFGVLN